MTLDLPPRGLALTIVESTVCLILNIASLVGNTMLCLAVYRNPRLRSTTNLYIVALSVGDLLCASLEMPLTFWTLIVGRWVFGNTVCQVHGFVDVFSTYCPVATMGLTAFNRYIRIVKTKHYNTIFSARRSKFWLACVWLSLALYLLVARVTNWQTYGFVPGFAACSVLHYTEKRKLLHYCLVVCVYFGVPFLVATFSYYKVFRAIRQHNLVVGPSFQNIPVTQVQSRISVQEIRISKSIAFVMAGFTLCWMPMWSLSLSNRFYPTPVPRAVPLLVTFFVFLSSSINPLIYAATNHGFRQEFRKMLPCLNSGRNSPEHEMRRNTLILKDNIERHNAEDRGNLQRLNPTFMAILQVHTAASVF